MSTINENGGLITYMESDIQCPKCTGISNISDNMDKAKYPVFNMKCPKCKGKITVSIPIMGGVLRCWETNVPKGVERQETFTRNKHNGKPYDSE